MAKVNFDIPKEVKDVSDKISGAGFEVYLVGGCVRDMFLGRKPSDWDFTTNANPKEIQEVFEHTFYENIYGTVGVVNDDIVGEIEKIELKKKDLDIEFEKERGDYSARGLVLEKKEILEKEILELEKLRAVEVTPYRVESVYSDNRRPDEVSFSDNLEDDLKRRDLTVNALAYNIESGEVIDMFGGLADLQKGLIKTVGDADERFSEDALRILRAVRFTAQLSFTLDVTVENSILKNHKMLDMISAERVRDEFVKVLLTDKPLDALFLAKDLNVLDYISKDLSRGVGVDQNGAHVFDVFEHLTRTMQHGADRDWSLDIRLAGLFHDISKPETRRWNKEKGDWTFYGHEVVGARVARKNLERLKFDKKTVEKITTLVRWHMFFSDPDKISLSAVRRIVRNVGEENVWDLIKLRICDRIGMGRPKEKTYRLRQYEAMMAEAMRSPVSVKDLKLNGDQLIADFGMKPGRKIGYILNALMAITLDEPEKNNFDYLAEKAREYMEMEDEELVKLAEVGKEKIGEEEEKELKAIKRKHKVQ